MDRITTLLNEYDSILSNKNEDYILERNRQPPDIDLLVESAWIAPYNQSSEPIINDNNADEALDPERIGLQYRYHLHVKSLKANRLSKLTDKPFIPVSGLTEGNDWEHNENTGMWYIPSMDLPEEPIVEPDMSYEQTFLEDDITIKECKTTPTDTISHTIDHKIQSDTGANANITSDLSILEDIKWVEPVLCKSAKKDASIEVKAIGKYSIRGTPLKINMYYCPDADNTIISPTAIVRQNIRQFTGYQKYLKIDKSVGHIRLLAREGYHDIHIPIYVANDLCYHQHSHTVPDVTTWQDGPTKPTVNRLSDAAKWELWHQRLVHPGTRVMEHQHQCSDGVPQLRGNAFWRCPSCMSGKLTTTIKIVE